MYSVAEEQAAEFWQLGQFVLDIHIQGGVISGFSVIYQGALWNVHEELVKHGLIVDLGFDGMWTEFALLRV